MLGCERFGEMDSKSITMVETIFDVLGALIKSVKITIRSKNERILNHPHTKGQAKRNRKQ